ncbi:unnamed protein product [Macrosiphum euphorbiae]|uniref:ZAD domain-containing protein n=1 Tax=Macrosiphum euphorbiae TaxID=13131 RepID=A0AAV0WB27_9HEMI|nr:unnamed protein product [Macrosiphum euphorbiae]
MPLNFSTNKPLSVHSMNTGKFCRICLFTKRLVDVLKMDEANIEKWFERVKEYFQVSMSRHDNKSTYLCRYCMQIIEDRIDEQNTVMKNQRIIGFLDEMSQKNVVKSIQQEDGQ